ncbi:dimethylarginine dimethylaminohydrolase 1 [Scenedesmus sp. NREL 46B-D3]|nr:dimethylarginine dimethylaminohydrolase 1 [Scenedesmus sp. NREL 46B-D3]
MRALVRGLARSFRDSLKLAPAAEQQLIDMAKAHEQKQAYVQLLRGLLHDVIEVPADDAHPDCVFIEDAAVVVGRTAVIANIGATERQGEEAPVAAALQQLGYQRRPLQPPATLDGGDVLQLPDCSIILVGLSARTNAAALEQMQGHLPQHVVHGVPVEHGLHLKSAVTALDGATLLFSDDAAGRAISKAIQQLPGFGSGSVWQHIMVPDAAAANVLLLEGQQQHQRRQRHVVMQEGCSQSEALLEQLCAERGLLLHKLPRMTEIAKADGALTCCSILLAHVVADV